jgi:hypothetical protein
MKGGFMLSVLSIPFSYWITISTNGLVDNVCHIAENTFPDHFPDQTSAKIYFFVVVNKKLLFEDSFSILFSGNRNVRTGKDIDIAKCECTQAEHNSQLGRIKFEDIIDVKQFEWQKKIQELAIPLFSEISLVMQAVMRKPIGTTIEFQAPIVYVHQYIGWIRDCSSRGFWSRPSGQITPAQIQHILHWQLAEHEIPYETIDEITDAELSFCPPI